MDEMHDMHCHLDFIPNAEEVAAEAGRAGTLIFANTVTPESWAAARERFAAYGNVTVGFGMHPWWADGAPEADGAGEAAKARAGGQRAERRRIAEAALEQEHLDDGQARRIDEVIGLLDAANPAFVGEIGLDFGWRHHATRLMQLELFEAIARWAAQRPGTLLSIHSIKAASESLDILERTGALASCTCVFHWFSGPSDALQQAVRAGCYFSCGKRMLATGKGREYVKAIPVGQLLLETDAPPERDAPYPFAEIRADLETAARGVAAIKGEGALGTIAATSRELLAPPRA